MLDKIHAVRGMNDILPEKVVFWQAVQAILKQVLSQFSCQEIRFPMLEFTHLFKRSIGDVTDIVEKEMYTFTDLNGDSITLRPEGTASCVRVCIQHGLLYHQSQKLWYIGSMFRHERPQKGRYREFTQLGVEFLNHKHFSKDVELIALSSAFWDALNISDVLTLEMNTLGTSEERLAYRATLIDYFQKHIDMLDEDSKRRLHKNPLRILDSKNDALKTLIEKAPKLMDALGDVSREHFQNVLRGLDALGIPYRINPCLVRGLDYYSHTVFEWVTDKLGSQATVLAGGRYDGLLTQLGGESSEAIGFAMGLERLMLLLETTNRLIKPQVPRCIFLMTTVEEGLFTLLTLSKKIRASFPDRIIILNHDMGSFKSQFKKADKADADYAFIIGEDECVNKTVTIKNLKKNIPQMTIPLDDIIVYLSDNE